MNINSIDVDSLSIIINKINNVPDVINLMMTCKEINKKIKILSKEKQLFDTFYLIKNKYLNDSIFAITKVKLKINSLSELEYIEKINQKYHNNLEIKINTYDMSCCKNMTDVSMLRNVHTLNLSYCSKITDVSMLGNIHELNLCCCNNITDVSMLGNVYTLDLSYCSSITDVSMLGNVYTLDLCCCSSITDVSMLGNVHTLDLSKCTNITDVSMLACVHIITLPDYTHIYKCDC